MARRKAKSLHATALELLARRAYSAAELAERLLGKGFAPSAVEAEVRKLRTLGVLDDGELARLLVRRQLQGGFGPLRLRASLRERRLPPEVCQRALGEVSQEEVEQALARALARAKERFRGVEASQRRLKVVRYLASRGFPLALCLAATADMGGELEYAEELGEPGDPEDLP